MGGALSIRLASIRGQEIEGLMLVNPSIHDPRPSMKLVPLLQYVIPSLGVAELMLLRQIPQTQLWKDSATSTSFAAEVMESCPARSLLG